VAFKCEFVSFLLIIFESVNNFFKIFKRARRKGSVNMPLRGGDIAEEYENNDNSRVRECTIGSLAQNR